VVEEEAMKQAAKITWTPNAAAVDAVRRARHQRGQLNVAHVGKTMRVTRGRLVPKGTVGVVLKIHGEWSKVNLRDADGKVWKTYARNLDRIAG
jgi:hypothetical protein